MWKTNPYTVWFSFVVRPTFIDVQKLRRAINRINFRCHFAGNTKPDLSVVESNAIIMGDTYVVIWCFLCICGYIAVPYDRKHHPKVHVVAEFVVRRNFLSGFAYGAVYQQQIIRTFGTWFWKEQYHCKCEALKKDSASEAMLVGSAVNDIDHVVLTLTRFMRRSVK